MAPLRFIHTTSRTPVPNSALGFFRGETMPTNDAETPVFTGKNGPFGA
jgi:hypothetical protein